MDAKKPNEEHTSVHKAQTNSPAKELSIIPQRVVDNPLIFCIVMLAEKGCKKLMNRYADTKKFQNKTSFQVDKTLVLGTKPMGL